MFDVSLQLLCTRKSGTLSRVVREINLLGPQYNNHQIKFSGEHTHLAAHEQLTPAVVVAAEKRLSGILGPVASFILESAVQDSNDAGELFTRLTAELNDQDERDYFLSIIEHDIE